MPLTITSGVMDVAAILRFLTVTRHFLMLPNHHGPQQTISTNHLDMAVREAHMSSMLRKALEKPRSCRSMRTGRNRRRPLPGSVRSMYSDESGHRFCTRVTAFTTLGSVLTLLVAAIVAICVLTSKPLVDVHISRIENVLASEQELMLDLHVHAINPNIVAVQISDMDIDIFAKSKHVGTSELWRTGRPHVRRQDSSAPSGYQTSSREAHHYWDPSDIISQLDGIDKGTDPIDDDDPATDSRTMRIGKILEFDSPLVFDPSPIRHHMLGSIGQIRLDKPGNSTDYDGMMRWEHVIEYDFELIDSGPSERRTGRRWEYEAFEVAVAF
ncbi:hypothetical protein P7C71_g4103, partial [Lecanoromycetidae sp. Uapishka_2]